jgi:hypothetical protein
VTFPLLLFLILIRQLFGDLGVWHIHFFKARGML